MDYHYRVYFQDTDAAGVVHHARMLNFAERARSDLLRDKGLGVKDVHRRHDLFFAVRHLEIDYLRPAHLDDLLTVRTTVLNLTAASMYLEQIIRLQEAQDQDLVRIHIRLACVNSSFKPQRLPPALRTALIKKSAP